MHLVEVTFWIHVKKYIGFKYHSNDLDLLAVINFLKLWNPDKDKK